MPVSWIPKTSAVQNLGCSNQMLRFAFTLSAVLHCDVALPGKYLRQEYLEDGDLCSSETPVLIRPHVDMVLPQSVRKTFPHFPPTLLFLPQFLTALLCQTNVASLQVNLIHNSLLPATRIYVLPEGKIKAKVVLTLKQVQSQYDALRTGGELHASCFQH
jgi:hypothetical protein